MEDIQDITIWPPPAPPAWRGSVNNDGTPVEGCEADIDQDALLAAYHDSLPNCPTCGEKITRALQGINRSGEILRIDGMGNLELKDFDEHSYAASVLLKCEECGDMFRPQSDVEAYSQRETVRLYDVPERINTDTTSFDRDDFYWG